MGEKMDWSEAEAVVRAFRAEQGATADVDVATLARALGTDVGEIRRLAGRKPRFVDRSGVLSAGIALAVAAFVVLAAAPGVLGSHPVLMVNRIAPPPPAEARIYIFDGGQSEGIVLDGTDTFRPRPDTSLSVEGEKKL